MSFSDMIPGVAQAKRALAAVAGGAIVFAVVVSVYEFPHFGRVDRQFHAGMLAERLRWEEMRNRQITANERKRAKAQSTINGLVSLYLDERRARKSATDQNSSLQQALAKSEAERNSDHEKNPSCAPRPAISRRVSRELDKVGR